VADPRHDIVVRAGAYVLDASSTSHAPKKLRVLALLRIRALLDEDCRVAEEITARTREAGLVASRQWMRSNQPCPHLGQRLECLGALQASGVQNRCMRRSGAEHLIGDGRDGAERHRDEDEADAAHSVVERCRHGNAGPLCFGSIRDTRAEAPHRAAAISQS
jgi:hypothetical protein